MPKNILSTAILRGVEAGTRLVLTKHRRGAEVEVVKVVVVVELKQSLSYFG